MPLLSRFGSPQPLYHFSFRFVAMLVDHGMDTSESVVEDSVAELSFFPVPIGSSDIGRRHNLANSWVA